MRAQRRHLCTKCLVPSSKRDALGTVGDRRESSPQYTKPRAAKGELPGARSGLKEEEKTGCETYSKGCAIRTLNNAPAAGPQGVPLKGRHHLGEGQPEYLSTAMTTFEG